MGLEEVAKLAEAKHEDNENDVLQVVTRRLAPAIATCPQLVSIIHETDIYIIVSTL